MFTTRVNFSGAFFAARDPGRTIRDNIRAMLEDIARNGEREIRAAYRAGEGRRAPVRAIGRNARVSHFIVGRVESLTGKQWQYHAVVSPVPRGLTGAQAVALNAAASRVEGQIHAFRDAARKNRAGLRDLAEGLE